MKPISGRTVVPLVPLVLLLLAPRSARAEYFADFNIGVAYSQPSDVEVRDSTVFPSVNVSTDVDFDPSISLGIRVGSWGPYVPWIGFALDFSFFMAEGDAVKENYIFPVSALILFRAPLLRREGFPAGRIQPYVGVGPSCVFSNGEVDLRPAYPSRVSTSAADVGLDARLGCAFAITRHFAMYVEYRFLWFEQNLREEYYFFPFGYADVKAETEFLTHHLLVGFSSRF